MFSHRIHWNLTANRLAGLLAEKRRAGRSILDLTESNPTRIGLEYPREEILSALARPAALAYDPQPRGLAVAREAVAGYYAARGCQVSPDRIHLTASTSEAYSFLFKLLTDHGQSVLVPQPSYPLFEFLATLEGVRLVPYQLEYHHPAGWRIDFDSLIRAATPETRAIILVSPNNPTGSFLKSRELDELNEFCRTNRLAIIADEVFGDYAFTDDSARIPSLVGNDKVLTFVMSGLSKILALPQMKLGWIVTNGPAELTAEAGERLDLIADTFLSVGAPVQHALPEWLNLQDRIQAGIMERVQGNLDWLSRKVVDTPCRLLRVEGGWCATLEVPRHMPEEDWILSLLGRDEVLVHPGYFFDFQREAFLILSLLTPPDRFQAGMDKIMRRMANP